MPIEGGRVRAAAARGAFAGGCVVAVAAAVAAAAEK